LPRPEEALSAAVETATTSGAILLIMGTATAMAWVISQSGVSNELPALVKTLPGGRSMFLLVSICVFILVGSLLEGIPAIVLFAPLLFPGIARPRNRRRALLDGRDPRGWASAFSRRRSASVSISRAAWARSSPGSPRGTSGATSPWLLAGLLVVAFVPQLTLLKV
jgi:hypothetical protein